MKYWTVIKVSDKQVDQLCAKTVVESRRSNSLMRKIEMITESVLFFNIYNERVELGIESSRRALLTLILCTFYGM